MILPSTSRLVSTTIPRTAARVSTPCLPADRSFPLRKFVGPPAASVPWLPREGVFGSLQEALVGQCHLEVHEVLFCGLSWDPGVSLSLQEGTGQVRAQLGSGISSGFGRIPREHIAPRSMLGKCGFRMHLKNTTSSNSLNSLAVALTLSAG